MYTYIYTYYIHIPQHTRACTGFSSATPKKEVALEYSGALSCEV